MSNAQPQRQKSTDCTCTGEDVEYLTKHQVPHLVEDLVALLLQNRPPNPRKFLRDYLDAELKFIFRLIMFHYKSYITFSSSVSSFSKEN